MCYTHNESLLRLPPLGESTAEEHQKHSWIYWPNQLLCDPLTFGWWLCSFLFLSFSFKISQHFHSFKHQQAWFICFHNENSSKLCYFFCLFDIHKHFFHSSKWLKCTKDLRNYYCSWGSLLSCCHNHHRLWISFILWISSLITLSYSHRCMNM